MLGFPNYMVKCNFFGYLAAALAVSGGVSFSWPVFLYGGEFLSAVFVCWSFFF